MSVYRPNQRKARSVMLGRKKTTVGSPQVDTSGGSFFDAEINSAPSKSHKEKRSSNTPNMFSRRAKVTTRRKQTPAQSAAIKATRLRSMVFAVAAVVIGVGTLVVVETKPAPKEYPIYVLKTDLTAGQKVTPTEVTEQLVTAPVPGLATNSMLTSGVLLSNAYAGEILQQAMFATNKSIPNGDVLVGVSMSNGAVPNAQLYTGEKVGVYSSAPATSPITGIVNGKTATFPFGKMLTSATVVYAPTLSSSSTSILLDLAVPSAYAGVVSAAAASSQITIGVL